MYQLTVLYPVGTGYYLVTLKFLTSLAPVHKFQGLGDAGGGRGRPIESVRLGKHFRR